MESEKALNTVYNEVLLAFEEALDEAENLASTQQPGERTTWLENATTSLISWGIDTRANTGSLAAVEGTPLGVEVRCILLELREHLGGLLDGHSVQWLTTLKLASSSKWIHANNGDTMAIMSGLVGELQDLVRPIRMLHASKTGEGPYRSRKLQVDDIYSQYIERKVQDSSQEPHSVGGVSPYLDRRSFRPSSMKHDASTENMQEPVFESAKGIQDYNQASGPTEELWGDVGTALRSSCNKNWHGADFIASKACSQIMSATTVGRLFRGLQPVSLQTSPTFTEDSVVSRCSKVLAICLYARLAPSFFCYLMECLVSDQHLPIGNEFLQTLLSALPENVDQKSVQRFCIAQWVFLAVQVRLDQAPTHYDRSALLPILCDPENDFLGHGVYGKVYKVRIRSDSREESNAQTDVFAMKHLIQLPKISTWTLSPKTISTQMRILDHPNLLQHVGFWVAGQNSYILFPLPTTNLRQLLSEETPPTAPTEQRRLLRQTLGIVSALKFLRSCDPVELAQLFHRNIRLQNIKIMRGDDGLEIWKLADFGSPISEGILDSGPAIGYLASITILRPDLDDLDELYDVFALGCILLEIAVWLHGAKDQTLRRQLPDFGYFWYEPISRKPPQLKREITAVMGRLRQEWDDVVWLKRIVDLVQSSLEVDWRRRPSLSAVEDHLANILASAELSGDMESDLNPIERTESSSKAKINSLWSSSYSIAEISTAKASSDMGTKIVESAATNTLDSTKRSEAARATTSAEAEEVYHSA